ncbi:hypothetical protein [Glutamicibacter ardleyensis]|uniref:hypothetical protein n=1 Tax=Glutamicibacter ardleyensis TaxID=225894 RepID=UPI003FD30682
MSLTEPSSDFRVLVVDDEPETARAHAMYVDRVPGFRTGAIAANGYGALQMLSDAHEAGAPLRLGPAGYDAAGLARN